MAKKRGKSRKGKGRKGRKGTKRKSFGTKAKYKGTYCNTDKFFTGPRGVVRPICEGKARF